MSSEEVSASRSTSRAFRRSRIKHACEPCKSRKRKCDGNDPCSSCVRYEYQCYYAASRRKTTNSPIDQKQSDISVSLRPSFMMENTPTYNDLRAEANSGAFFPKSLCLEYNAANSASIQGFGWNLGLQNTQKPPLQCVTHIITQADWRALCDTYKAGVHCVYSFLDMHNVAELATRRWTKPPLENGHDHILAGIAALGSLFSQHKHDARTYILADCARDILEKSSLVRDPSLQDVQAWILRTLFLRCTDSPYAAWMASCVTMQVAEAAGAHQDFSSTNAYAECQRSTFWIAKLLNTWISFESGRSRVVLNSAMCRQPSRASGDNTVELINLLVASNVLDPERNTGISELEDTLNRVEQLTFDHIALILSQTNLCFAIYRRIRLSDPRVKQELTQKVISAGRRGLNASLRAVQSGSPWWHVSNVPFQFVCILLAMDTSESLSHVKQAVTTLEAVAESFATPIVQKALVTVELFIQLSQMRKQRDAEALLCAMPERLQHQPCPAIENRVEMTQDRDLGFWYANDLSWITPTLENINWEQLATQPL